MLALRAEALPGSDFTTVAKQAHELAKRVACGVVFCFNGTEYVAWMDSAEPPRFKGPTNLRFRYDSRDGVLCCEHRAAFTMTKPMGTDAGYFVGESMSRTAAEQIVAALGGVLVESF